MKPWWSAGLFAAGVAAGALGMKAILRTDTGAEEAAEPLKAESVRAERIRAGGRPEQHGKKWSTLAAKLADSKDAKDFKAGVSPGEERAALEALLELSGPEGLDYSVRRVFDEILNAWAARDFDAAWQWSRADVKRGTGDFVKRALLRALAETDPDRALELYLAEKAEGSGISPPAGLLDASVRRGADSAISMLERLPKGNSSFGSEPEYPADFDFAAFLAGAKNLIDPKTGNGPPTFPANLFQVWSERDPEAAHAAFLSLGKNGGLPFNSWDDILDGVEKSAGAKAVGAWAAEKIQAADPVMREVMIGAVANDFQERAARRTADIAALMPDDASRDSFLITALAETGLGYSHNLQGAMLSDLSSPQARMEALRAMDAKARLPRADEIPDVKLQEWGITRAQMEGVRMESGGLMPTPSK